MRSKATDPSLNPDIAPLGNKKQTPAPSAPRSLLSQLAAKPAKLFSGAFRQQVGALCYQQSGDDIRMLVMTSRESGRWVIPKGWPIKGKKSHQAAAIEAWEEAGVRGRVTQKPIGRYTYIKQLDDGDVAPCVVEVFAIEATKLSTKFKERGERQIAWVDLSEAARRVREIELKSLIIKFKPEKLSD